MTAKSIIELKGHHINHDLYVVATGPSGHFIDQSFFNNKISIGVNEAWIYFSNLDYLVRKESARGLAALKSGIPLITSKYNAGSYRAGLNAYDGQFDYYVFDHQDNLLKDINFREIKTDQIVVSYSTITSAMHVAAYMGAANIILVGHDCGLVDGMQRLPGLPGALGGDQFHRKFLQQIEPQTLAVRAWLKDRYGCNIYSLNPWINFGLEGHIYER